jgi:formylglycine-generating enzyme required for sulfatase activity
MKIKITTFAIFICFTLQAQINFGKQIISLKKWERTTKKLTPPGFTMVKGGTFTSSNFEIYPDRDTSVLISNLYSPRSRRITLSSFIISKTEVTNKKYRAFANWVIDSIALSIKAEKDPSFYNNPSLKTLDWSRRNEIRDTSSFPSLYPLYIKNELKKNIGYILNTNLLKYKYLGYDSVNYLINIYPDTLVWYKDKQLWADQLIETYFSNPAYNEYPVVGVSWQQASAYCDWLNRNSSYPIYGETKYYYRLPSAAEFEYCQNLQNIKKYYVNKSYKKFKLFGNRYDLKFYTSEIKISENGKYLASFGKIIDRNGFLVKDGVFGPEKVAKYPTWGFGFNDIAGNVSEWILESVPQSYYLSDFNLDYLTKLQRVFEDTKIDSLDRSNIFITTNENFDTINKKIYDYIGDKDLYNYWLEIGSPKNEEDFNIIIKNQQNNYFNPYFNSIYLITKQLNMLLHDFKVLNKLDNPKFVMGGSWFDGPSYLQSGVKQVHSSNESHSTIGFRVVAGVINEEFNDY